MIIFQGCRVRDHIVTVSDLPTEGDKPPQNRVYDDLLSHRDVICVPYQRLSDARYKSRCLQLVCQLEMSQNIKKKNQKKNL